MRYHDRWTWRNGMAWLEEAGTRIHTLPKALDSSTVSRKINILKKIKKKVEIGRTRLFWAKAFVLTSYYFLLPSTLLQNPHL